MRSRLPFVLAVLLLARPAAMAQSTHDPVSNRATHDALVYAEFDATHGPAQAGIAEPVTFTVATATAGAASSATSAAAAAPGPVTPVPEPHAWLLILSGLAAGAYLVRRTRHG